MVSMGENQDLNTNLHIDFNNPDVNVGGGYNTHTDTFVAPVSGLYVFFVKVTSVITMIGNY
jgi:hypothetical protein